MKHRPWLPQSSIVNFPPIADSLGMSEWQNTRGIIGASQKKTSNMQDKGQGQGATRDYCRWYK